MKQIYKYPLRELGLQKIIMPTGAFILKVGEQFGELFLWAIVETDSKLLPMEKTICMFGTGHELPENIDWLYNYIDTVICANGLVWHIFEPADIAGFFDTTNN